MLPPAAADPRPRLLILGCSTRAAAWSAIRAGFRPICVDDFGDEDLRQIADVPSLSAPWSAAALSQSGLRSTAWLYVGGAEHESDRLAAVSTAGSFGPLLATPPERLSALRDPERLQHAALSAGLPPLMICRRPPTACDLREQTWLVKPRHCGGGRGVRWWTPAATLGPQEFLQQFARGRPMSGVFLATDHDTTTVGFTEQLIGDAAAGASSPFAYCGNIAPVILPTSCVEALRCVIDKFRIAFGLRGLCGLDFVRDGSTARVVELNPRYPASCELLELSQGRAWFAELAASFGITPDLPTDMGRPLARPRRGLNTPDEVQTTNGPVIGKLILYAERQAIAPDLSRFLTDRSPWTVPFLADVPRVRTAFEVGQPICTVFATGRDAETVRRKLSRRVDRVRRWLLLTP